VGDDGTVESLTQLREQRAFLCRLSPDRALGSVEEADTFLRDRGLLTRTADCALPSLYEACHEDPYQPGRPGFATWPATKWPWFGELADRGHLITAVHRGKSLLISGAVARLLDPICRAEITRMGTADRGWGRLLDHLAAAGPSSIEDLRTELGLKRQELKALRAPLERCGAIVSRSLHVTAGQGHQHSSELARWDQAYPGSGGGTGEDPVAALGDLIAAAVRAAVLAPETELRRWFSWPWYWADSLVDDLIGQGRLRRIDGHVTPRGIPESCLKSATVPSQGDQEPPFCRPSRSVSTAGGAALKDRYEWRIEELEVRLTRRKARSRPLSRPGSPAPGSGLHRPSAKGEPRVRSREFLLPGEEPGGPRLGEQMQHVRLGSGSAAARGGLPC